MNRDRNVKHGHDKSTGLLRTGDVDDRLNRIVDQTVKEAAERAKSILGEKESDTEKRPRSS